MKRRFRAAVLLLVLTVLLTTVVFADSGPKPQLAVRVVHAPQEAYYLDLLDEGTYTGAYETDETGLDPALLQAFRAAIPSGWHGCISQGSTRAPIWGDLTGQAGENGEMLHTFRYVGVPQTYRILMVTQSGEVFLSDVLQRDTLQSIVTVDWAAKTVEPQPVYRGYALQFLATFVPTLVIEFLVLLLFGFSLLEDGAAGQFPDAGAAARMLLVFCAAKRRKLVLFPAVFPGGGGCNADRVVRLRQNAPGKEQTEGSALRHLCERLLGGAGLCACRARVASCREPALRL